ncbi:hypothetical protein TcG_01920 [Trypanosoma cruzi]|nr:hypothetical protein TcG_01920 [Trypanosoma cruzi]
MGFFFIEWTAERRWFLQFFVSILICLNNGACFCFGIFSPYMKQKPFMYSQSDINLVSTVGVILSYFSLPTGFLYDHKGPKVILFIGTLLGFLGWLGMFLMFVNVGSPLLGTNVLVMCLFYGVLQFSSSFYETGSVLTNLDAFSCYQGRVIVIQKTFMGLGSSVIVQIYIAFFETHFAGIGPFFLFLLIYSLTVGVLGTLIVRLPSEKTQCLGLNVPDEEMIQSGGGESRLFRLPFNVGTGILFTSIAFILLVTLLENFYSFSDADREAIGIVTIVLCVSFSFMILVTPSYSVNRGGYDTQSTAITTKPTTKAEAAAATTNTDVNAVTGDTATPTFPPSPPPLRFPLSSFPPEVIGKPATATNEIYATPCKKGGRENGLSLLSRGPRGYSHFREGLSPQDVDLDVPDAPDLTNGKEIELPLERERHVSRGWNSRSGENFAAESEAARQEVKLNSKSLWYNLRRRELWLMWYVCLASWSSATLVSTNSSQIYESMDFYGYSPTVNVVLVSIYGVASAIGRVFIGLAHPILVRKKIPVSSFFCIAPVLNVIGLPLFLAMKRGSLAIPFFVVGLATGVSWGSTILIIKGLFAPNNCGKHYSALYTAGIISPLIFNVGLFGPIYDFYSKRQGLWETRQCEGRVCIWIPLVICAIVNAIALPLSVYFVTRVVKRGGLL